jgi:hypothetical protein
MQVIDIQNSLDEIFFGPPVPRLKLNLRKLGEIITWATAKKAGIPVALRPLCSQRPGRNPCRGKLAVDLVPGTTEIHWRCPECRDEGVVTGWEGEVWDMTNA